jgi:hypothetical protein
MAEMSSHIPSIMTRRISEDCPVFDYRYSRYPLNFDLRGGLKKTVRQPAGPMVQWRKSMEILDNKTYCNMQGVWSAVAPNEDRLSDTASQPSTHAAIEPAPPVNAPQYIQAKTPTASSSSSGTPTTAYQNIIKSLADKRAATSATTSELETSKKQHALREGPGRQASTTD